jgi:hypothetical protein
MDGLLTRPPHRLTSFDVFHYIPVMGYVGADPGDLQHLSRRCHEAAEDLEHRRRRVGAELRAVGMESPIEHQLARVEAWLRDQERSLHHRAGEAEAAAGGGGHHGWGLLGHAASSFAHGVWDGTTGIVKGAVGLGQLQLHGLEEPFRLAHAFWDGGASGVADEVRTELERDEQMVKGLYAEALHAGELANRFGPAGPLYFAWDVHRHGLDETLSSYAYDAGTLVPDAVITVATMGGGEVAVAEAEVAEAEVAEAEARAAARVAAGVHRPLPTTFAELPEPAGWGLPRTLERHLHAHMSDFGATSAEEYVAQAEQLLEEARQGLHEVRVDAPSKTIWAYDRATRRFGAYNLDGTTKTFFRPSSLDYFEKQGGRVIPR